MKTQNWKMTMLNLWQMQFLTVMGLILLLSGCASLWGERKSNYSQNRSFNSAYDSALINAAITSTGKVESWNESAEPISFPEAIARIEEVEAANEIEGGKVRLPAMHESAISYGARMGLASATRVIAKEVNRNSENLTTAYNFREVMMVGPDSVLLQPPVISEAKETWESFAEGKTLRVADTVYEIIKQSRFTSQPPVWQSYLLASFEVPDAPPPALLPTSDEERAIWIRWVWEGWQQGFQQARKIFATNLNRLNRDYQGMIRYAVLVRAGRVAPAVMGLGDLGNTGGGEKVRINDRAIRITKDPSLLANP